MSRLPAILLGIGFALAIFVAHALGQWQGQLQRYGDCQLTTLGPHVFYACPVDVDQADPAEPQGAHA